MKLKSLITPLGYMPMPVFTDTQVYMEPFELGMPVLPLALKLWEDLTRAAVAHIVGGVGTAFLTVDQKVVHRGLTHRRPGPHVDGNYLHSWRQGDWKTGGAGRELPPELHRASYCAPGGGMLIASSHALCRAWVGEYEGEPGQGGDCQHLADAGVLDRMDSFLLEPFVLYLANSTCIHASLPSGEDIRRSLFRITLPHTLNVH